MAPVQETVEKVRITSAKGRVERLVDENGERIGPYRVWLKCARNTLAECLRPLA